MKIMDVARYIVYLSYGNNNYSLTPLKLQKILYYAQGWSCVWDEKFLFDEEFEAWQYGPVNRLVYDTFKTYKGNEIPLSEGKIPKDYKKYELDTIEIVWKNYGHYSANELVEFTHREEPWQSAYKSKFEISNTSIKCYFANNY